MNRSDPLKEAETGVGWATTTLTEVADMRLGKMLDAAKQKTGKPLPYLRNINVRWYEFDLNDLLTMTFEDDEVEEFALRPGDLLVCEGGEPGRSAIWQQPDTSIKFQKAVHRVRLANVIDPRWVMYHLRYAALTGSLDEYFTGSTIKHLTGVSLARYRLPIAPLAEQKRIVAKVEEVLARVNAARERLAKVPTILKRFRQSVLAAACSGRLTVEWREANQASISIKEIEAFRERETREAIRLSKPRSPRRYIPAQLPDTPSYELPATWVWAAPAHLADPRDRYSLAIGPFGSSLKVSDYRDEGVPLVFVRNIRSRDFSIKKAKFVTPEKAEELQAHEAREGDVLITKMGDPPGDACTYPADHPPAIITADCIRLAVAPELAAAIYIEHAINSPVVRDQVIHITMGVAQPKMSLERFGTTAIPLPPLAEQCEIARRVQELFSLADKIEAKLAAGTMRAEKLVQATLAKAFRGELVPTEAELAEQEGREYETADALLERIRQARDSGDAIVSPRQRRRATTPTAESDVVHRQTLFDVDIPARRSEKASAATQDPKAPSDASSRQKRSEKPQSVSDDNWVEISYDDAMAHVRDAFAEGGARDREQAVKDVTVALGYQRVGSRVRETVDGYLRAAVRRGILVNENGQYSLLVRSAADYSRDHLIEQMLAAMNGGWVDRDEAVRATAKHLGFQKAGSAFREEMKSAINGAIRRGLLVYEGTSVKKA